MKAPAARATCMTLLAMMLGACSTSVPLDKAPAGMSEMAARETLVGLRGEKVNAWVNADNKEWVATGRDLVIDHDALHFRTVTIPLQDITRIDTSLSMYNNYIVDIGLAGGRHVVLKDQCCDEGISAAGLAAAIVALKQAAATWPARAAAFTEAAASYRAAEPKPAPTEQQRQREVQAESFVRNKQFLRAAETYQQALQETPAWPQGHFNFALVLESLGDYELAIEEMQRYLALVPDAQNARAAQDKIYEWETHLPAGAGH
jgi:tetratricopeptide (TPR) repeat protein